MAAISMAAAKAMLIITSIVADSDYDAEMKIAEIPIASIKLCEEQAAKINAGPAALNHIPGAGRNTIGATRLTYERYDTNVIFGRDAFCVETAEDTE